MKKVIEGKLIDLGGYELPIDFCIGNISISELLSDLEDHNIRITIEEVE